MEYTIKPYMDAITAPKYVNDHILMEKSKGMDHFVIDLRDCTRTYPNICVPVAAIIDFYTGSGTNFSFLHQTERRDYLEHTMLHDPLVVEDRLGGNEINYPLDKVWRFGTSEGIGALVGAFIKALREADELAQGVLNGIEWCINETMDNVLNHSEAPYGFIMAQLQKENKRLAICIFDWGRGIYQSLKNSKHKPASAIDAITMALRERITRDENVGQGNGMWGLSEIIKENQGIIKISSCGASYSNIGNQTETVSEGNMHLGQLHGTTCIDFQLDYRIPIDISKALGGHEPADLWLENKETDNGGYRVSVAELAHGTGSRASAVKLRNLILNIFHEKQQKIIIDFSGVTLVSSSFSDELIGKIIKEYGFMFFMNTFQIIGVSGINAAIINRSVEQRMAQKYYDPAITEIPDGTDE